MASPDQAVRTYRELAEDYGRQGQAQLRDRFLVLAADAALAAGQENEAELLRGRLLQHNPHHLLKPYRSFAEAMKAPEVQNYVGTLRRSHPYEKAEMLLEGLRRDAKFGAGTPTQPHVAGDDLKVFRLSERAEEARGQAALSGSSSPTSSPSPARPVPPAQVPSAFSPVRRAGTPETLPLQREPYPALNKLRTADPEKEEREPAAGAWVATVLFVVLLLAVIALAGYTLLRPFLPHAWFGL
jgi:hypothetical protein